MRILGPLLPPTTTIGDRMNERAKVSPSKGKNGLEANNGFDVSLDKEDGFVFVPIDAKLLRTIRAYVRKMNKYHDAETNLIRHIHEDLLSSLASGYDYWFAIAGDDFERDIWYPDLDIFKRLPPVNLRKGPCVNPRIMAARIKHVREVHEKWEREDKDWEKNLEKVLEKADREIVVTAQYPKKAFPDGEPTEEQQAEISAVLDRANAELKAIIKPEKKKEKREPEEEEEGPLRLICRYPKELRTPDRSARIDRLLNTTVKEINAILELGDRKTVEKEVEP